MQLVKSPTLDVRWHEYEFISKDNPHFTTWFCKVELGLIQNFKTTISSKYKKSTKIKISAIDDIETKSLDEF
jgi:hypothetical protein